METEEIIKAERERIKDIILKEIEAEAQLERNNPAKPKKSLRIKINYLFERLEHLRSRIFFKIDSF